ncbi:EscU/YscU/HrcU family type III secretion system export apparatus switch protein [Caballeronia sp. LZ035]|uniref:EscU/YscU/HrcU family type III secretion system export apparatus switch protein n=1 Tax=Caballeronia sp. LZ035 TaxID=3038568 RepID=UPI0028642765|nr:EscU/YscU/HrcU family type III secretion system export apparatus switch protein [Caballeronia sp. LZ035]MDR5760150.1 EscU/YscU/HrcU family type III secretion system export apparatus switch protein [Caballeronia sp. LZ035]
MSDKTIKPSPRRLQRARKDGDIPKSVQLTTTASGLLWWLLLAVQAPNVFVAFVNMLVTVTAIDLSRPFESTVHEVLGALVEPGRAALALAGMGMMTVIVPELAQTRGLIAFKRVAPDFKRLNPIEGFKNLFGLRLLVETGIMLVQLVLLGFLAWQALSGWMAMLTASHALAPRAQISLAAGEYGRLLLLAALLQIAPAAADYALQRILHVRRLRMDKDEVKRENRDDNGDHHFKNRRRAFHRELNQ